MNPNKNIFIFYNILAFNAFLLGIFTVTLITKYTIKNLILGVILIILLLFNYYYFGRKVQKLFMKSF